MRDVLQRGIAPEAAVASEVSALARRAKLISHAITLCTITALSICAVIAVLFLGASLRLDTSTTVAWLFIAAMLAFFLDLSMFVREIFLATATLRVGLQQLPLAPGPSSEGLTARNQK
jgi:hypothetical protein